MILAAINIDLRIIKNGKKELTDNEKNSHAESSTKNGNNTPMSQEYFFVGLDETKRTRPETSPNVVPFPSKIDKNGRKVINSAPKPARQRAKMDGRRGMGPGGMDSPLQGQQRSLRHQPHTSPPLKATVKKLKVPKLTPRRSGRRGVGPVPKFE
ncbi:hypothetical protein DBV15_11385, partial [Temnothorax longispinosus]